jgi:hypothetical protein
VNKQHTIGTCCEHLLHHPVIGTHRHLVNPTARPGNDHGRGSVATPGRTAVDEPLNESTKLDGVEWCLLDVATDGISPSLGVLPPLVVTIARDLEVVERLSLLEQLDRSVDTLRYIGWVGDLLA